MATELEASTHKAWYWTLPFRIMAPKLLRSSEEMCDAISALFDFATADDILDRIMYEIGSSTCFFFLMNSLVRHDENGLQVILKGEVQIRRRTAPLNANPPPPFPTPIDSPSQLN